MTDSIKAFLQLQASGTRWFEQCGALHKKRAAGLKFAFLIFGLSSNQFANLTDLSYLTCLI